MFDYVARINELSAQRFCCSQTLIALALELKGVTDERTTRNLVRAMSGLCGGMGGSGKDCGALTGGACVIGLFCGSGHRDEEPHPLLHSMINELVKWFTDEYKTVECSELIGADKTETLCPNLMKSTFENAVRIMLENGVEIN